MRTTTSKCTSQRGVTPTQDMGRKLPDRPKLVRTRLGKLVEPPKSGRDLIGRIDEFENRKFRQDFYSEAAKTKLPSPNTPVTKLIAAKLLGVARSEIDYVCSAKFALKSHQRELKSLECLGSHHLRRDNALSFADSQGLLGRVVEVHFKNNALGPCYLFKLSDRSVALSISKANLSCSPIKDAKGLYRALTAVGFKARIVSGVKASQHEEWWNDSKKVAAILDVRPRGIKEILNSSEALSKLYADTSRIDDGSDPYKPPYTYPEEQIQAFESTRDIWGTSLRGFLDRMHMDIPVSVTVGSGERPSHYIFKLSGKFVVLERGEN